MADKPTAEATVDTATKETKSTEEIKETKETKEQTPPEQTNANKEERSVAEESLDLDVPEPPKEDTSESTEEETPIETEETQTDEESQDSGKETEETESGLSEFLEEEETTETIEPKKDGLEKRRDKLQAEVNQLTARKYQIKEETEKAQATKKDDDTGEKIYSETQLDEAERKAHNDGDTQLLTTIAKERIKNMKRELRTEYQSDIKQRESATTLVNKELNQIRSSYDYLSAPNEPEIYPGARKDLDINNQNSNLVRLATMLYGAGEDELVKIFKYSKNYNQPGGRELAVSDALNLILKKRRTQKTDTKETKSLKKRLTKEKRKRSLGTSGAEEAEASTTPKKPKTAKDALSDEIADRKKRQSEKSGGFV